MSNQDAPTGVGGKFAGRLSPAMYRSFGPGVWAIDASLLLAVLFGTWYLRRGASVGRTIAKASAVGLLDLGCLLAGAPVPLLVGLTCSAAGDAFLAVGSDKRLRLGLGSFLVAHIAYIVLFLFFAPPMDNPQWSRAQIEPSHYVVMAGVAVTALGVLAWLWPRLEVMKAPVSLYVAAIVGMVVASQAAPPEYTTPSAGALLFFASDAVLAAQLFRGVLRNWIGDSVVWWFYYVGQVLIMTDFAGQWVG